VSRIFGKRSIAGRETHPIGLGGMPLSIEGRPAERDAIRVIHAALDHGIELLDTADVYAIGEDDLGHNEVLVGRAIRAWGGDRARVVIATKGGVTRPGGGWAHDARPEHLRRACEASLARLGLERIPLYQLHALDDRVPIEESVGALARLRDEGKIGAIGISNVTTEQLVRARAVAEIASVQNRIGFYDRDHLESAMVATCEGGGIALIAHSPLGGWKAGGIAHEPMLQAIARTHRVTPHQVVLAWLLARSPAIIPIPGASKVENALASAEATTIALTAEDLAAIDGSSTEDQSTLRS